jgi:hypothetical protein
VNQSHRGIASAAKQSSFLLAAAKLDWLVAEPVIGAHRAAFRNDGFPPTKIGTLQQTEIS